MKVIVTGTTGYVGEGVLRCCLDDSRVEKVLSVSRKPLGFSHPKLEEYIVSDFMAIPENDPMLQCYDAVYFCLGTTSVGTPEDVYKVVCHDIPVHFAKVVGPKKSMTFTYVSGMGTSDSNPQAWVKVKRSTELEIEAMGFKGAFGYRPCIMKPHKDQVFRKSFQTSSKIMYPLLRPFNMSNTMQEVTRSMIKVTFDGYSSNYLGVKDIKVTGK